MNSVSAPNAKPPAGHYSPALVHQGLVWISGQLPIAPATGEQVHGEIEAELDQVFRNLDALLQAAGTSRAQVMKVTIYVADVALWPRINAAYAEFFGPHKPARTIVPTGPLHHGFLVELDAVAALPA